MSTPPGGSHTFTDVRVENNTGTVILGNIGAEIYQSETRRNELMTAFLEGIRDSREYREDLLILKRRRAPGTCEWIREHPWFQMWRDGSTALLWMSGPPGIGKTFLSSYIAETLEFGQRCGGRDSKPDPMLLDFYCNNQDNRQSTIVAMLKGLVQRAINQAPRLKELLFKAFEKSSEPVADVSRFVNLWSVFKDMLEDEDMGRVYLLLDGLDECDAKYKDEFLERLKDLAMNSLNGRGAHRISVLVTSRDNPPSALASTSQLKLDRKDGNEGVTTNVAADVRRFIKSRIEERYPSPSYSEQLRVELVTEFESKSEETFLWVGYAMEILQNFTPTELKKELKNLPPRLDNMYELMFSQIPCWRREKALSMLRWVSAAVRPLRLIELFAAIQPNATLKGSPEQQEQHRRQYEQEVKEWIGYCGHVLAVQGNTVVFVHSSARDYIFQESYDSKLRMSMFHLKEQDVQFRITRDCLAYLQNGALPTELASAWKETVTWYNGETSASLAQQRYYKAARQRYDQFPLLDYCVKYWPEHARLAPREVFDLRDPFFLDKSLSRISWLVEFEYTPKKEWMLDVGVANLVHLAARLGLPSLMLELKDLSLRQPERIAFPDPITNQGNTPLMCASKYGHVDVVKILLEFKANVNSENCVGLTSILLAANHDWNDIVDLLFNHGAHIGIYAGHSNISSLSPKIVPAYRKLIQRLASNRDVHVNDLVSTRNGRIPLLLLSQTKDFDLLLMFLQGGANPDEIDRIGNTPLICAAWAGNTKMVTILMNHRARVDLKNSRGETALMAASILMPSFSRHDCIDILLDHGANLEERDANGDTPLIKATRVSYLGTVRHLLNKGADANATDANGRLPLEVSLWPNAPGWPADRLELSKLLLEHTNISLLGKERKETVFYRINQMEQGLRHTLTLYPSSPISETAPEATASLDEVEEEGSGSSCFPS